MGNKEVVSGRFSSEESNIQEVVRGLVSTCCGWPVTDELSPDPSLSVLYRCSHCRKLCGTKRGTSFRPEPRMAEALNGFVVDPRVAKLPQWAQALIARVVSERDAAVRERSEALRQLARLTPAGDFAS